MISILTFSSPGKQAGGHLFRPVSIAPLVSFRIFFGLLMFCSLVRFWYRGWVTSVYIQPKFHFTYLGFEWVHPLGPIGMHALFLLVSLASLLIMLGLFYRVAAVVFFFGFTYIELLDVTTYLNHYYFISLVALVLVWLPANRYYAVDCLLSPRMVRSRVPAWNIGILRFQMAVVYIFAGLAKLNADWLLHALPMRIWLPAKTHLPLMGELMYRPWVAYTFSWFGAAYDLFIVFFLLNKKSRPLAYFVVLLFHIATAIFFPGIGMFPYVMIVCSLVFFSGEWHMRFLSFFPKYKKPLIYGGANDRIYRYRHLKAITMGLLVYALVQILVPMRFFLYPGQLFWNEEGYRFSWRVMLMEKSGTAYFTVRDINARQHYEVNNAEFLTPLQEKMMSTQPDMILKYAHHLSAEYKKRGVQDPAVYAEVYVSLNGARSQLFIDSTVNLAAESISWKHYRWVLPGKK